MMVVVLSLALVANSYEPTRSGDPRAERVVTASVQIVAAETIDFNEANANRTQRTARQHRVRDGMPLVEFY